MLWKGSRLELKIWGESHGDAIGMILSGIDKGQEIDINALQAFVDRRRSRPSVYSTTRYEPDQLIIKGGIKDGITTCEDIKIEIKNTLARSTDYSELKNKPRPSHADYPAYVKYGLDYNMAGGGKFSGRMTAPLTIAGGIAVQLLLKKQIDVIAYISSIKDVKADSYTDNLLDKTELIRLKSESFPVLNDKNKSLMLQAIDDARMSGDSVGGVIEGVVLNMPVGIGDTMFLSLESKIASLVYAIPAVKGVEFGSGFNISAMNGSMANDNLYYDNGKVMTLTNHNGGINGGLSNGMPITLKVAIKPTPSISIEQKTVDLIKKENTTISIKGRHDACIVPRAAVCVESAIALAILDSI